MSPATPPSPMTTTDGGDTSPRQLPSQSNRYLPPASREDCWSPEETHALIEAWGSRHLSLNRGCLRQQQWSHVAAAVNSDVADKTNRRRTDVQCKNRIDTLKKKYKIEKAKAAAGGSYVSTWPFFSRLDFLVAGEKPPTPPAIETPAVVAPPLIRSFPVKKRSAIPKRPARWLMEEEEDDENDQKERQLAEGTPVGGGDRWKMSRIDDDEERRDGDGDGFGCRKLAEAILRFGEVYERVESMKHEQLIELEKQRMQFAKDLEFQRMKLLMETQVQLLSGIKRSKHDHSDVDSYL